MVVREEIQERKPSLGRKLFEVPGYTFRIFVTNLADPPEEIWRDYNQRACMEQRIEELKSDLAADDFCLQEFFATEAAFLSILMLFNLLGEFQRATGMTGYRQPASLRVQVFLCGAILGRAGHRTVLHLSAAWGGLEKRNPLFDKLLLYEIPTSRKLEIQPNRRGKCKGLWLIRAPKRSSTYEFGISQLERSEISRIWFGESQGYHFGDPHQICRETVPSRAGGLWR